MTANMYRVGDYVYFETSSTSPYQIRRIEELHKMSSGHVEAKVMCFYRRRDLPNHLVQVADKQHSALDESYSNNESNGSNNNIDSLQRHQMRHRELFLSRQIETLPATHIRGKCSVTLFNETETVSCYTGKEDVFFYCLVYDPQQKSLMADKGEIRIGSRHQCDVPPSLKEAEADPRDSESPLETLMWTPNHGLSDTQIDQFLIVSRSVGTFARALDCSSSVKQPSLHMSAAAASRDITLFHAMDTLHLHNYSVSNSLSSLVPEAGPLLCRDEMEEWSASEANLFEEALDKYGKDFNDIRQDFLPWKTLKNVIEYYYMWKTTDRYVQQKRVKAVEAESKLKQVYIPNYNNKSNSNVVNNGKTGVLNGENGGDLAAAAMDRPCGSCSTMVSAQWHMWGSFNLKCRLCTPCWTYWKRYGGFTTPSKYDDSSNGATVGVIPENCMDAPTSLTKKKLSDSNLLTAMDIDVDRLLPGHENSQHRPHRCSIATCQKEFKLKAHLARHYATAHGMLLQPDSPRPIMKTRTAFYLRTSALTRISRRLCRHLIRPRHATRAPFFAINIAAVKQEFSTALIGKSMTELKTLLHYRRKNRGSVTDIASRLGNHPANKPVPEWLILTARENMPKPERVSFPKPPKAPDGSLMYERVPNNPEAEKIPLNNVSPTSLKRRAYDEVNGVDAGIVPPPTKRANKDPTPLHRPTSEQYAAMLAAANTNAGPNMPRHILNGKPKIPHMTRSGSGRKQVISWMEAPDDLYFRPSDANRKARREISSSLKRAARKPWWRPLATLLSPQSAAAMVVPTSIPPTIPPVIPPTIPTAPVIPPLAAPLLLDHPIAAMKSLLGNADLLGAPTNISPPPIAPPAYPAHQFVPPTTSFLPVIAAAAAAKLPIPHPSTLLLPPRDSNLAAPTGPPTSDAAAVGDSHVVVLD